MRLGIELPEELLRAVQQEAERRSVSAEEICREAIEVRFPPGRTGGEVEFQEQMRIAREGMRRYSDTLRELAR